MVTIRGCDGDVGGSASCPPAEQAQLLRLHVGMLRGAQGTGLAAGKQRQVASLSLMLNARVVLHLEQGTAFPTSRLPKV